MLSVKKLTKWKIEVDREKKEITHTKYDMKGNAIIAVFLQYDDFEKSASHSIFYYPEAKTKWGDFVADYVTDQELAFTIANFWLKKKGYEV